MDAQFFKASHPLATLLSDLSAPWVQQDKPLKPQQGCEFDAEHGLTDAWAHMADLRPLDDILYLPAIPTSIMQHRDKLQVIGLSSVRRVGVNFQLNAIKLQFDAPGPLTDQQAIDYVALAGHSAIAATEVYDMKESLGTDSFTFEVTISVDSGEIQLVTFRAVGLPLRILPRINLRLSKFLDLTPKHDDEDYTAVAWSYDVEGRKCTQVEKIYSGRLGPLLVNSTKRETPTGEVSGTVTEAGSEEDTMVATQGDAEHIASIIQDAVEGATAGAAYSLADLTKKALGIADDDEGTAFSMADEKKNDTVQAERVEGSLHSGRDVGESTTKHLHARVDDDDE